MIDGVAATLVLVADEDLPAGTLITPGALSWQRWPEAGIAEGFVVSAEEDEELKQQFIGAAVRRGIITGTPINTNMVVKRDEPGFLAGALDPGKRGIAVSVTNVTGAAGFILPGDRVDVILTHDIRKDLPPRQDEVPLVGGIAVRYVSDTLLHDVRVLAVDQKVNDFEGEAEVVETVTLEVTPKQAEKLALGETMGDLSLALRSLTRDTETASDTETVRSFTTDLQASGALSSALSRAADLKAAVEARVEEAEKAAERARELAQRRVEAANKATRRARMLATQRSLAAQKAEAEAVAAETAREEAEARAKAAVEALAAQKAEAEAEAEAAAAGTASEEAEARAKAAAAALAQARAEAEAARAEAAKQAQFRPQPAAKPGPPRKPPVRVKVYRGSQPTIQEF